MMMPSIFGENLFNDWMDFSFPDIDKKLYGKRADRMNEDRCQRDRIWLTK